MPGTQRAGTREVYIGVSVSFIVKSMTGPSRGFASVLIAWALQAYSMPFGLQ